MELPSKFHFGRDDTSLAFSAGNVRVLERVFPSASTQTYSAMILSDGKGRESYLEMTLGSSGDWPVVLGMSMLRAVVDVDCMLGAKALADESAVRNTAVVNFMMDC